MWFVAAPLALVALAGGTVSYERFINDNFHVVIAGKVYRSAQPDEDEVREWVSSYGLKTIINLRGDRKNSDVKEVAATAKELNVKYVAFSLPNTRLATAESLQQVAVTLETAQQPFLIHCKAGADRTGLASVMAAMAIGGQTYQQAKRQLSPLYLHFDYDPQHIGGVADQYERYCREKAGGNTGGWREFRQWLFTEYRGLAKTPSAGQATSKPAES
jgi:protein tyrosine/serine phosphatase